MRTLLCHRFFFTGVRCERASSYLRGKGLPYNNVEHLQGVFSSKLALISSLYCSTSRRAHLPDPAVVVVNLSRTCPHACTHISAGGIERYLEAFPDGGAFKGKNFVFDERVVHPNSVHNSSVVGRCLQCDAPHDDYSRRHRCSHCRLLVLICTECSHSYSSSVYRANDKQFDCMVEGWDGNSVSGVLPTAAACLAGGPSDSSNRAGGVGTHGDYQQHSLLCRHCMAGRLSKWQPATLLRV